MTDYTPEQLIERLYEQIESSGKKQQMRLPKPEVITQNRKTFLANYRDICKKINQHEDEVKSYFEEELQEKITIDGKGGMIIHRVFRAPQIQSILTNYLKNHVLCKECGSPQTKIIRENRIQFMHCDNCLSRRAVA